jgi:hypothetical protein
VDITKYRAVTEQAQQSRIQLNRLTGDELRVSVRDQPWDIKDEFIFV